MSAHAVSDAQAFRLIVPRLRPEAFQHGARRPGARGKRDGRLVGLEAQLGGRLERAVVGLGDAFPGVGLLKRSGPLGIGGAAPGALERHPPGEAADAQQHCDPNRRRHAAQLESA
jgi:hypothetical protein